jgi:hypothetical protein
MQDNVRQKLMGRTGDIYADWNPIKTAVMSTAKELVILIRNTNGKKVYLEDEKPKRMLERFVKRCEYDVTEAQKYSFKAFKHKRNVTKQNVNSITSRC